LDLANSALGDLNPFLAAISTIEIVPFNLEKIPNIVNWYKNAPKVITGWNENVDSLKQAKKFLEEKLAGKKGSGYSF